MGPLKEQRVLLSAKPSLQPPLPIYTLISIYVDFAAPSPPILTCFKKAFLMTLPLTNHFQDSQSRQLVFVTVRVRVSSSPRAF